MPKYGPKRAQVIFCNVLLTLLALMLLTACGAPTTVETPPAPTPTPTTPPTPTPTPTPEVTTKTYEGKGFTIGYPDDWTLTEEGNRVEFTSPNKIASFALIIQDNPNGVLQPETLNKAVLGGMKAVSEDLKEEDAEPTKTVNGTTWGQVVASGTVTEGIATKEIKLAVLSMNYPESAADTRAFVALYATEAEKFDETESEYFLPILESFQLEK